MSMRLALDERMVNVERIVSVTREMARTSRYWGTLATFVAVSLTWSGSWPLSAAEPLSVSPDIEGGSARIVKLDQDARRVEFTPGGDPARGWPCWWYFRIDGVTPGESITLRLRGSTATLSKEAAAGSHTSLVRPLAPSWAMPDRAAFSNDGQTWRQTDKGQRQGETIDYVVSADAKSLYVAWGPPYTPGMATQFVRTAAKNRNGIEARELCRSRDDRPVPLLHVMEGDRPRPERFGVWVQARQHAWESGSSWVAQGFAEWLLSDDPDAAWLRREAEIFLVPIMDIDNTATGNGGKDALPHDHNRDWSNEPHWNETRAAQRMVGELIDQNRMDVFLDLHNPAPGDPSFFYILPAELLPPTAVAPRDRLIELAYGRISRIKPLIPMSNRAKVTGPCYHPLWRQISANWVAMNGNPHTVSLCLETAWNHARGTPDGYRAVGANLAAAVREHLAERARRN